MARFRCYMLLLNCLRPFPPTSGLKWEIVGSKKHQYRQCFRRHEISIEIKSEKIFKIFRL